MQTEGRVVAVGGSGGVYELCVCVCTGLVASTLLQLQPVEAHTVPVTHRAPSNVFCYVP